MKPKIEKDGLYKKYWTLKKMRPYRPLNLSKQISAN
jgi:hypothetical protein